MWGSVVGYGRGSMATATDDRQCRWWTGHDYVGISSILGF